MSVDTAPSEKTRRVATYLRREVAETDGDLYVKSKFIAEDLDLSAKEIGSCIRQLCERDGGLAIEKWSYTGSTTWRVSVD